MNFEREMVGSLLHKPSQLDECLELVEPEELTDDDCRAIYGQLAKLSASGLPHDDIAVTTAELLDSGCLSHHENPAAVIGRLTFIVAQGWYASYYARLIRRQSGYRHIERSIVDATKHLDERKESPQDISSYLQTLLDAGKEDVDDVPQKASEVAQENVRALAESGGYRTDGIGSGCVYHDEEFGFWFPGELIILASRPGVGKSKMAEQVACHVAGKGRGVLVASLEMSSREWADRMAFAAAGIDGRKIRRGGTLSGRQLAQYNEAAQNMSPHIHIWARSSVQVRSIRAKAKHLQAKTDLGLVIVDYLQRLKGDNLKVSRYEQVTDISRQLKDMAQDLGVPVLALCQLNRQAENSTLSLDQLRESGQIEQDADEVIMLSRKRNETQTEMFVAKHRNAPSTVLNLSFDGVKGFSGFMDADRVPEFDDFNEG